MGNDNGYARPELLAEPDWLWERRGDPKLRIIDCADMERYRRAHIPGAVGLPVHGWLKEPGSAYQSWGGPELGLHVMPSKAFAELMEKLGVSDDTTVVAYDDAGMGGMQLATRLWWVLNYYGHTKAKVLNGIWFRWVTEGRPVTYEVTTVEPGQFTPRPNQSVMADLNYVRARLNEPEIQILDVRPDKEWSGQTNPFKNKGVGHIPGALNVSGQNFVTDDSRHIVKPASELKALLADAGVQTQKETIVHCQGGINTTRGVFALQLLGWDRVRAYDASMAEWANQEDTPLVTEPVGTAVSSR